MGKRSTCRTNRSAASRRPKLASSATRERTACDRETACDPKKNHTKSPAEIAKVAAWLRDVEERVLFDELEEHARVAQLTGLEREQTRQSACRVSEGHALVF